MSNYGASRCYLNEKWNKAKRDMEGFLDVNFESTDKNCIEIEELRFVRGSICENLRAIIKELERVE